MSEIVKGIALHSLISYSWVDLFVAFCGVFTMRALLSLSVPFATRITAVPYFENTFQLHSLIIYFSSC